MIEENIYSFDLSFDSDFNEIIKNDKRFRYLPWVGKNYKSQNNKIMIVAESVYVWGENDAEKAKALTQASRKDFCRTVLFEQGLFVLNPTRQHEEKKMFRNFEKAFYGKDKCSDLEIKNLWESVVFHEFVQEPMDDVNHRPTKNHYNIGAIYLEKLINIVKPNIVIYFGTSWDKFASIRDEFSKIEVNKVDDSEKYNYKIDRTQPYLLSIKNNYGNDYKIIFIKHPSMAFSHFQWHEVLSKFIKLIAI